MQALQSESGLNDELKADLAALSMELRRLQLAAEERQASPQPPAPAHSHDRSDSYPAQSHDSSGADPAIEQHRGASAGRDREQCRVDSGENQWRTGDESMREQRSGALSDALNGARGELREAEQVGQACAPLSAMEIGTLIDFYPKA